MTIGFYVKNLGCKVNKAESESLSRELQIIGYQLVAASQANLIIINTCTVTGEADSKSRKAVRKAANQDNQPWVIVTGCGVVGNPEQFNDSGDKTLVIPAKDQALLKAKELLEQERQKTEAPSPLNMITLAQSMQPTTRVGIKIQDGCDNRCTFCIVSSVRGPARSVDVQQVVDQCNSVLQHGSKELVFTGINLGQYHNNGLDLTDLLDIVLPSLKRSEARIRLSSIEPPELSQTLLELIADSKNHICAHLHLPLQSGSNNTLQAMGRKYDSDFYLNKIRLAKKLLPNIAISTDIIVGFPQETEDDFEQTVKLCQEVSFMQMHVFKYSKRAGTLAAEMPGQVPSKIAQERSIKLRELASQLKEQDARSRIGATERILIETPNQGRSESYHAVKPGAAAKKGELLSMTFTGYDNGCLLV